MKNKLIALSLTSVLASSLANSAELKSQGTGQVPLDPYNSYNSNYSVNDNNATILTINNTTDQGKAFQVRFSESLNKREVLSFKLYLSPNDAWEAVVFALDKTGPANLITRDSSCTVPAIKTSTILPTIPDGTPYVPFRNYSYTGENDDAGPDDLSRTREGYVEFIELGSVIKDSPVDQALTPQSDGVPKDCLYIVSGWDPGGFWTQNPKTDLGDSTGGFGGTAVIVKVP